MYVTCTFYLLVVCNYVVCFVELVSMLCVIMLSVACVSCGRGVYIMLCVCFVFVVCM